VTLFPYTTLFRSEGTLIAALSAGGMTGADSLAAVLVYRVVSFILVAIVGWIIFLALYRTQDHEDLAADRTMHEREIAELDRDERTQWRDRDRRSDPYDN